MIDFYTVLCISIDILLDLTIRRLSYFPPSFIWSAARSYPSFAFVDGVLERRSSGWLFLEEAILSIFARLMFVFLSPFFFASLISRRFQSFFLDFYCSFSFKDRSCSCSVLSWQCSVPLLSFFDDFLSGLVLRPSSTSCLQSRIRSVLLDRSLMNNLSLDLFFISHPLSIYNFPFFMTTTSRFPHDLFIFSGSFGSV